MEDESMGERSKDGGDGKTGDRRMGGRWRDRVRWKAGLFGRQGKWWKCWSGGSGVGGGQVGLWQPGVKGQGWHGTGAHGHQVPQPLL